jgi:hypothetical protein
MMRSPIRPLRLTLALACLAPAVLLWLGNGCGPDSQFFWVCLDPVTGKESSTYYDSTNYANGQPDPCHCYDKCGPAKTCPIVVDAGPPPPGCPTDGGTDGGP